MVLIISDSVDIATNNVIDWLLYYKIPFIRINSETKIKIKKIEFDKNFIVEINDIFNKIHEVDLMQLKGVWYRRGIFRYWVNDYKFNKKNDFFEKINQNIDDEFWTINGHTFSILSNNNNTINDFRNIHLNKMNVLQMAKKCGLRIPETFIFTNKTDLINILNKFNLISKAINNAIGLSNNKFKTNAFTSIINKEDISKISDTFFPTLFQKYIEKKYELRIFFLKGKFFPSAVFSQNDDQTKVDFRQYNFNKFNRTPPYILPKSIENKLLKLFNVLKLNSGSVDMIYSTDDKYYFLEINPVGQFHQVSYPCNYYLFREIARNFMNTTVYEN